MASSPNVATSRTPVESTTTVSGSDDPLPRSSAAIGDPSENGSTWVSGTTEGSVTVSWVRRHCHAAVPTFAVNPTQVFSVHQCPPLLSVTTAVASAMIAVSCSARNSGASMSVDLSTIRSLKIIGAASTDTCAATCSGIAYAPELAFSWVPPAAHGPAGLSE